MPLDGSGRTAAAVAEAPSWVLDTNVLVSGLLSPSGPPARLLDMVLARRLRLTLDERIEAEYREVLARPRLSIPGPRLEALLAALEFQDWTTALPLQGTSPPDRDDVVFLEVATQAPGRILVTGNERHFPRACRGSVRVLAPAAAWRLFVQILR